MSFRTLGFAFLLISQMGFAQGRGPAVEDFVGIEIEHPAQTPPGTEGLFNFEKDMNKFEQTKGQPLKSDKTDTSVNSSGPTATTTAIALIFLLGLPAMIWFIMMNNLRQKAHIEGASNIEVLEKYRRERQERKAQEEEYKKVS